MSLSRQDIVLGRALLSWRLVDRASLLACAQEIRQLAAAGRPVPLGQILVQRGLLSVERYQTIVGRIHQKFLESSSTTQQVQDATEQIPFITRTGRYTQVFNVPVNLESSTIDRAVSNWQQTAGQVTASGSSLEPLSTEPDKPADSAEPTESVEDKKRPDRPIRKRLNVPAGQERFPIGDWMVEEYIASGNWGIVYRVSHPNTPGTFYALKVLKILNPPEQIRQRFIQEALTMRKLSHPGIVRIHDAGVVKKLLWFVMDYLEGSDLEDVLKERGPLGVTEAVGIMRQLCSAVSYAHSLTILHRDLKPENIVLKEGSVPVLTDFGLAKDIQEGPNLTAEGQRLGTPFYMAPELLLEAGKATKQTEVYALGTILYKILTGKVPYQAKGIVKLMDKIEEGKPKPLRKLCPEAPKALEKLCLAAIHKKPAKRPQTVDAFLEQLEQAL